MKRHAMLFVLILAGTAWAQGLSGGPYAVYPLDINAGGTYSEAGKYVLIASTGQSGGVGVIAGGPYEASDGFWRGAAGNALLLSYINGVWGSATVDPDQLGYEPNDRVTLTAEPIERMEFRHWLIFDPNHRGDANYAAVDANNPTSVLMDDDREVTAVFKCGEGPWGAFLPMIVIGVALLLHRRR